MFAPALRACIARACAQLEHAELRKAHAALPTEGAVRTQLLESLQGSARHAAHASDASVAVLSAELAALEAKSNRDVSAKDGAEAELASERGEHEACRLQLISAQAALQREALRRLGALAPGDEAR